MTWSIGEFLAALHRIVPPARAAEWDSAGLQLGDANASVRAVGVCHEVTEEVVRSVQASPVDLLVTYHPLLFRPTTRVVAGRSPVGRAFRLIGAGVSLAVAHTSFDAAAGGTADSLASELGLEHVASFGPVVPAGQVKVVTFVPESHVETVAAAMTGAGGGEIGNYSGCSFRSAGVGAFFAGPGATPVAGASGEANREPEVRLEMIAPGGLRDQVCAALAASHPYEEPAFDVYDVQANLGFLGRVGRLPHPMSLAECADIVSDSLGVAGQRVSGGGTLEVAAMAVLPGSGGSFVPAARAAGADVLVTGDVGHHTAIRALDLGMGVVDVGHAPSERPGMQALARVVAEVAGAARSTFQDLTVMDPTPWRVG